MNTFIEATASEKLPIRTKCYTIDRFGVFSKRMYTYTSLHIPQSNGRIERCASQGQIHIRIVCAWTSRRPFDSINFLTMCL